MKFMQRGAATAAAASPPDTPKSEEEHSAKRRKVSHQESASSTAIADHQAIRAALEEEERKRQVAIEKQAEELGDAHWMLDIKTPNLKSGQSRETVLNIVQVGFGQLDTVSRSGNASSDDSSDDRHADVVQIRRFNMKKKKVCELVEPACCRGCQLT